MPPIFIFDEVDFWGKLSVGELRVYRRAGRNVGPHAENEPRVWPINTPLALRFQAFITRAGNIGMGRQRSVAQLERGCA